MPNNNLKIHNMKKINLRICVIISLICFVGCKNSNQELLPVISLENSTAISVSAIFPNTQIIPLETNESGLFGIMPLQIEATKDKIFVLNQLSSHCNILCFNHSGKFLFSIDKIGKGPEEYTMLCHFCISDEDHLVLTADAGYYLGFDFNGQFLYKKRHEDTYYERQIKKIDSAYIISNDADEPPVGYDLLSISANTFNIIDKSLAKSPFAKYFRARHAVSLYENNVLFYDSTDTIFDISNIHARIPKYAVDYGKLHRESYAYLKKLSDNNVEYNEFMEEEIALRKEEKFKRAIALFENENFLLIAFLEDYPKTLDRMFQNSFLVYDKSNSKTYYSRKMQFDLMGLSNMGDISVMGVYDGAFYAIYTPEWTDGDKKKISQSKLLSDELKQQLAAHTDEDNPILIILK
ncbi:hypothetical protein FACS189464_0960 [Bacteroidia bacterium]|nr:hypothetical protein FACS189464_0960 [Bacteroidia bacterium]